jgi:yersiniabactin nonribosomal peptide synthetase
MGDNRAEAPADHSQACSLDGAAPNPLISHGIIHRPPEIEATVRRVDGLRNTSVCALQIYHEDAILLLAEVDGTTEDSALAEIASRVRASVGQAHGFAGEVALVPLDALPLLEDGTPNREASRRAYRRDELAILRLDRLAVLNAGIGLGDPLPLWQSASPTGLSQVSSVLVPLTKDALRRALTELLETGEDRIGDEEDLIAVGLDSIGVMGLVNDWRTAGVELKFGELMEKPTLTDWWALLSAKLASGLDGASAHQPAGAEVDRTAPFTLTPMQHAYWIGRGNEQTLGGVGCHFYAELDGTGIEPQRLEAAVRALFARHEMLRARFLKDGRQQIGVEGTWPGLTVHDLRGLPESAGQAQLRQTRQALSHRRLAVENGEVFDVQLSLLREGATRLHVNIDLLVADVLSIQTLYRDLARLYQDTHSELPSLDHSFARYLVEQDARRAMGRERARSYWQDRLDELPGAPGLPLAIEPEHIGVPRVVRRAHRLSPASWQCLAERAREHGLTLSMTLAAAFTEILAAWSGEPRFLLNLPLFDRETLHPDSRHLVADFTNLILLDVDAATAQSFAERAKHLQSRFHADVANSEYSGIEVLRDLTRTRKGHPVNAPVVFTSALGMGDLFDSDVRETLGTPGWMISQTPQVWLDHQVLEFEGGLLFNWDAVEELFPAGLLDAMFDAYVGLLGWLAAPEADWGVVPELLPDSQAAVRREVNATAGAESGRLLHEAFFAQAQSQPERLALVWGEDGELSYGELAERACRLAGLLAARGVKQGDTVAVTLPKGPAQVVATLGVLCAGGAYVPVGVDQPLQRRERICANAEARVVLTGAAERDALDWPEGVEVVAVEDADEASALDGPAEVSPESLAYVIYTSGSTGEPKGVEITHRSAVNTIEDVNARFGVGENDRVLAVSALDFDLSVYDVFGLLGVGGAVVLIGEEDRREPRRWLDLLVRWKVTVWNSVPALLDMLLVTASEEAPPALRLVLVSGDWVGLDLPGRMAATCPDCRFVALGGATEAAIWSNYYEVERVPEGWRSIPYGYPLRNQEFRVVDARGRDCPDWVQGELWIGGVGVARGYRANPEGTVRQFVERDGERWYCTGDLGRYWPDGTLEFLGRVDHQVKVRGHRIELGEIEAALESHPVIRQAAVIATVTRSPRLVALLTSTGPELDPQTLASFLAERLPAYSIPNTFIQLESFPLTSNGKIDRDALARIAEEQPDTTEDEPPQGELETTLAHIWSELLDLPTIGRNQNFFVLGGDSLLATRLVTRLRAAGVLGAELTELFAAPTLKDFATTLTLGEAETSMPLLPADPAHRNDPFPATDVQRAYWFGRTDAFALGGVGCHFYSEFDGADVDLGRLEEAWNLLIARHEMLRAVFDTDGNQRILAEVPHFQIPVFSVAEGESDRALDELRASMSHQVIDPTCWPVFDVRAVRYDGNCTRIGVGLDSIILDALSAMIVFCELEQLYENLDADLPPVGVSFRDYVLGMKPDPEALAAAQGYWMGRLADLPPGPQLPLATDPALVSKPQFIRREMRLPGDQWQAILERARQLDLTPSTVLATTFAEILGAWSAQPQLTINLTLFDRREVHPDINNVLGDFTSLLLVAYRPREREGWLQSARRLQRQVWRDLEHSEVSAVWVLRELARQAQSSEVSMPVVFTSTIGVAAQLRDRDTKPYAVHVGGVSQTPQVWLDHQVLEFEGGLLFNWDAVEELFPAGLLDAMFDAYVGLLGWLATPDADWGEVVPELLPDSQVAVRRELNATAGAESGRLLHEAFFAQAQSRPERLALAWGDDGQLSYGELAQRARAVAGLLVGRGVKPGDTVAVTLPKGPAQVVAALGVLFVGGAYVPVGVDQPVQRRERIYANAEVRLVVTGTAERDALDWPPGVELVTVEDAMRASALDASAEVSPESLAYVIYTSGSTGEPKGVEITHRSVVNTIEDVNARFGVGEDDRTLAVSALDFDLSVYDLFGLLAVGGAVVLIDEADRREPRRWLDLLVRWKVTVWNSVPALLDMLLVTASEEAPPALRLALVSGDWVGLDLPGRLAATCPGARFVALGGATEAAIWSNYFPVEEVPEEWRSIPYGYPLRNQTFRVVDARGRDCPDWVRGELWIGGVGVAQGYRGNPEGTARQFVERDGERWYRTGDLGRYWPDGTLEFLGRVDHQVKVRGHRIELGEIEAALESHPQIRQAVAIATATRPPQLIALLAPNKPELDQQTLASFLSERLPAYSIPNTFIQLESFPLTSNGKIDRDALTQIAEEQPDTTEDEPPQGELETTLAHIWSELLDLPTIGRNQNFISIGGDSVMAAELAETVRRRLGVEVSLREFFAAPTVAGLASTVAVELGSTAIEQGVV